MENGTQETTTEPAQLSLTDENISQADYERLRNGEKVEVEVKSAPAQAKPEPSETVDESETSETDDDAGDDESEVEESLEARPKKKSGTQRRIEKLVKQRTQAEQEREYWRQEALKHSAPKNEQVPETVPPQTSPTDKPVPDSFETHQEYIEALTDWKMEQRDKQREIKAAQDQAKTEYQKRVESHSERVKAFTKTHEDFDELMSEVDDVPLSITVQEVILASENGPDLMYELAKDRKEFERICKLPAIDAARALGRLEARIAKSSEEPKQVTKPKTTKAPPPPKPITASSASGKKSVYDDDLSQAEYERIRAEQERRRASY